MPRKFTQISLLFQLFMPLLWGQQTLQPTVIRNLVFQFDVSNNLVPEHNKVVPVKFHINCSTYDNIRIFKHK